MVGCETSRGKEITHNVGLQSPTIYTNALQNLLDLYDETYKGIRLSYIEADDFATHPDETLVSLTRYGRNDLDTPTYPLRTSDT